MTWMTNFVTIRWRKEVGGDNRELFKPNAVSCFFWDEYENQQA